MKINVNSEIGKLNKVLVHRPGKEVERIYPELFERLLFDGIMFLERAREEHDYFTNKLREEDIEVFYIEKLVGEILDKDPSLKEKFIDEFIVLAKIENIAVKNSVKEYFMNFSDNNEMVNATIAGVKKSEIKPNFDKSLSDLVEQTKEYPFYVDPIPNILFQRDPIASIFDGMNIHNMNKETRKRERLYYNFLLKYHPEFNEIKPLLQPEHKGSIEGGDILVMSKEMLFIGISERTTTKAVEELSKILFARYPKFKKIIGIEIPHSHATMHLDTILTQMDKHKFSIDADMYKEEYTYFEITREGTVPFYDSKIIDLLKKYISKDVELLVVGGGEVVRARREQWNDGANCLAIAPGKIVVYNRNQVTNELMKKAGVEVIEVWSSELSLGRGGPRCMTMPLDRDEVQ